MEIAERSVSKEDSLVDTSEREVAPFEISWTDFKRPERSSGGPPELAAALAENSALLKRAKRKWRKSKLQTAILARALAEYAPEECARYLSRAHRHYQSFILRKGGLPPRKLLDECYFGFILLAEAASLTGESTKGQNFSRAAVECAKLSFTRDEREDLIQDILARSPDSGGLIPRAVALQTIRALLETTEDQNQCEFLKGLLPTESKPPAETGKPSDEIQQKEDSSPATNDSAKESPVNPAETAPRLSWFNKHPCHLPIPQFLGEAEKTWIRLTLGHGMFRAGILGVIALLVFFLGEVLCHVLTENALEELIERAALGFLPGAGGLFSSSLKVIIRAHLLLIGLLFSVPLWWTQKSIRAALASMTFGRQAARQKLLANLVAVISALSLIVSVVLAGQLTHTFVTASALIRLLPTEVPEDASSQLAALSNAALSHPAKARNQFDNYIHTLLALHFERLGAYEPSIAQWGLTSRRAYFPMPSREFVNYEVQVRRRLEKTGDFEQAMSANPDDPQLLRDFGTYLLCHRRLRKAINYLLLSIGKSPELGGLLTHDTSVPEAVSILEKNTRHIISSDDRGVDIAANFLRGVKDTTVVHRLGWAAQQIDADLPAWALEELKVDRKKLLLEVEELCSQYQDNIFAQLNLAEFFSMVTLHKQADKAFEKVEALGGLDAQGYTTWGISLYSLNKYASAIARFEKAWGLSGQKQFVGNVLYRWGWSLARSNHWEEAHEKFQEAIKVEDGERKYHYQYGRALNFMQEYEKAIGQFQKATEPPFPYRSSYAQWAYSLNRLGRPAEAVKQLSLAIRNKKRSSSTYTAVEQTLQGLDDSVYPRVLDSVLHMVKELRSDISSTWLPDIYLAKTLSRLGEEDAARRLLYRLEFFVPWHDRFGWITRSTSEYTKWGEAYLSVNLPDLARLKFRAAIEAKKINPDAYEGLVMACLQGGRREEALAAFEAMQSALPGRPKNHYDYAKVLDESGDTAPALEHYLKALELGSKSKSLALATALAHIKLGHPQKAVELINSLNSNETTNGPYYREICKVYMAVGEWGKAELAVSAMLKRNSGSSTNQMLAGYFYLGQGEFETAHGHFYQAVQRGNSDLSLRVLQTLCSNTRRERRPDKLRKFVPWPDIASEYLKGTVTEEDLHSRIESRVDSEKRSARLLLTNYLIAEKLLEKVNEKGPENTSRNAWSGPNHCCRGLPPRG
jgi:tetratricopeptide (TPR) repeat protein